MAVATEVKIMVRKSNLGKTIICYYHCVLKQNRSNWYGWLVARDKVTLREDEDILSIWKPFDE